MWRSLIKSIAEAGVALRALADGPAQETASTLSKIFAEAGQSIEASLAQAAKGGELEFRDMAESVLKDIARIVAESLIAKDSVSNVNRGLTMNFNLPMGTDTASILSNRNTIATAVAQAASLGGRFL